MEDALGRDALASLQWSVWHYGYQVLTATLDNGTEARCLTEKLPTPGRLISGRRYYPLQEFPALFQTFAETTPTEEGIHHFVNIYGKLGLSTRIWRSDDLNGSTEWPYGELVEDWRTEIEAMRQAIALWGAIQTGNTQWFSDTQIEVTDEDPLIRGRDLRQIARDRLHIAVARPLPIQGNYAFVYYAFGGVLLSEMRAVARDALIFEDLQSLFLLNDMVDMGWKLLDYMLNRRLEEHTATRMRYITDDARLRLHYTPRNLLGALWLQLARGIDGEKTYLRCRGCETWLEVSLKATGYRTSKVYCSDACRSKAYRERQMHAQQLAAQGMTVEAIAHTLDAEPETVQGWLAKMPSSIETRRRGRPRKQPTSSK